MQEIDFLVDMKPFCGLQNLMITYLAEQRIEKLKEGNLKLRPINKPIHQPKPNDKIARIPEEWTNLYNGA